MAGSLTGRRANVARPWSVGYLLPRTFAARGWNRAANSIERSPANGNSGLAFERRLRRQPTEEGLRRLGLAAVQGNTGDHDAQKDRRTVEAENRRPQEEARRQGRFDGRGKGPEGQEEDPPGPAPPSPDRRARQAARGQGRGQNGRVSRAHAFPTSTFARIRSKTPGAKRFMTFISFASGDSTISRRVPRAIRTRARATDSGECFCTRTWICGGPARSFFSSKLVVVDDGQTIPTVTPVPESSGRSASAIPWRANLLAL